MPDDWKAELGNDKVPQKSWLNMPAIGMEAEFNVWIDGKEINPEKYWHHPSAFLDRPLLPRTAKSLQLPTGGALYFDRGVIEVVTPVIEIAPGCTARAVRNLWEQIGFVRDQLTGWGKVSGHDVRLAAYSAHYNISFELAAADQDEHRNIRTLALLLAYILPFPVALVGCNRRSTGVGVRPRGNRIEVTVDFTPDPGLMIATATLIVPMVREILSWPSYELSLLDDLPIPVVAGVIPGKHTTRKGWLTRDFHYPVSPFTCDVDAKIWSTRDGRNMSLRAIAFEVCWYFRRAIRRVADPFSFRLLFAVLTGRAPSMLDLADRPAAYEDVGRLCRWGMVTAELKNYDRPGLATPETGLAEFVARRAEEKLEQASQPAEILSLSETASVKGVDQLRPPGMTTGPENPANPGLARPAGRSGSAPLKYRRRASPSAMPRREYIERRRGAGARMIERRTTERRKQSYLVPFPDRRLTRSAYEQVFLKLVSGSHIRVGGQTYKPVGMKGWYHAIFRSDSDGQERLLTIDQLLTRMKDWQS